MEEKDYEVVVWAHYVIPVRAFDREHAQRKGEIVWGEWPTPGAKDANCDHVVVSPERVKEGVERNG